MTLPNVMDLKAQAKRLRSAMASQKSAAVSHSQSLELLASQYGYRDWNTLSAAARQNTPRAFKAGDQVSGRYLDQPFQGKILSFVQIGNSGLYQATIQFDTPVDVVTFDSFSSFRSRVTCAVRGSGVAVKKTSNGKPHIVMDFAD